VAQERNEWFPELTLLLAEEVVMVLHSLENFLQFLKMFFVIGACANSIVDVGSGSWNSLEEFIHKLLEDCWR